MRAGDVLGICHIENVDHGSHNMTQLRSRLAKCRRDRRNCGLHLHVRISVEVRRAGRGSRDEYMLPDADGARVAVGVLERIAR